MGQCARPVTAVVTLKIILRYLVISVAWIVCSGLLISALFTPGDSRKWGWIAAGCIYAAGTALWLFGLLRSACAFHSTGTQSGGTIPKVIMAEDAAAWEQADHGMRPGEIAHDFNNVLTGISGNISYAQTLLDATHPANAPLISAHHAVARAAVLAQQFFVPHGEIVFRKAVLSLKELINESMELMLRGSNVNGEANLAEDLWCVEGDGVQLTRVLNNVLINAVQAMPGGGHVLVSAENCELEVGQCPPLAAGNYVRVHLQDNGPGMPQEILGHIFDSRFSTKACGNGLGLSSARAIVLRHGGQMTAVSKPGHGTCFTLLLPATMELPQMQTPLPMQDMTPPAEHCRHLLIMDDDTAICSMAVSMLEHLGYCVDACTDSKMTVKRYAEHLANGRRYDAVIMDLTMPGGLGGKEVALEILAIDPSAYLLLSSGYSHDPIIRDYSRYGFKGVLEKPYTMKCLQQVLSTAFPAT